jgi:hypothetical protein
MAKTSPWEEFVLGGLGALPREVLPGGHLRAGRDAARSSVWYEVAANIEPPLVRERGADALAFLVERAAEFLARLSRLSQRGGSRIG